MKFASFGRERDLSMIEEYVADPDLKARYLKQTAAAHDLNEGIVSVDAFVEATREAVLQSTQRGRDRPLILLSRIARYYPECLELWDELAESQDWQNRFTVACRLYWDVPDAVSDRLFNILRHDRSERVREISISRYENRANEKGEVAFGVFDSAQFDERVRKGEVKI
jgi:hypothetical protein